MGKRVQFFTDITGFYDKCGSDSFLSRNLASRPCALEMFIQQDGLQLSITNGGVLWQAAH